MMTDADLPELLFGVLLIAIGLGMLVIRSTKAARYQRREACQHPAWRAISLPVKGEGQALAIRCFRCCASALDRFRASALSDGSIAIANETGQTQILVINGVLHEIYPFEDDSPEAIDGELIVYVDQADLRKL